MPVPYDYANATVEFTRLLEGARDAAGLTTTHQAYTMLEGVLVTFRRRLSVGEALEFANVLPAVARAIFVANWDPDEPRQEFGDRDSLTREVQSLRPAHNFSPDNAIQAVAVAMRANVDEGAFDRALDQLSPEAR